MMDKKRLLRQFALPTDQTQAFTAVWRRQPDLFGDGFELTAQIDAQKIVLLYAHFQPQETARNIWSMSIGTGAAGRAKIVQSLGIHPPVKTIHRACAIMAQAIQHMQANPGVAFMDSAPASPRPAGLAPQIR